MRSRADGLRSIRTKTAPPRPMAPPFDVVVVGSGFGGAVTSCRLSEAGLRVLILERGRRWSPETFPRKAGMPGCGTRRIRKSGTGGWISACSAESRSRRGLVWAAAPWIYANVLIEASRELFDRGWPAEINWSDLAPFYERVERMLQPRCVPENQVPERLNVLRKAACASGFETRFRPLPVAITFDDEWRYAPRAAVRRHAFPEMDQRARQRAGHVRALRQRDRGLSGQCA